MRKFQVSAAGVLLAFMAVASIPAVRAGDIAPVLDDDETPFLNIPDVPGVAPPIGKRLLPLPNGNRGASAAPGVTTPLVPPAAKPPPPPDRSRAEILDDLFGRLANANDTDEATGIASRIERVWLQSGSDTADLLMSRAASVAANGKPEVALHLLDQVVRLDGDWVEGWNKRATIRFMNNDDAGSMEDIAHVLTLEPRHFGALNGMALILQRHGLKKEALTVLRKVAAIYPHNEQVQKQIDDLSLDVEGRPI